MTKKTKTTSDSRPKHPKKTQIRKEKKNLKEKSKNPDKLRGSAELLPISTQKQLVEESIAEDNKSQEQASSESENSTKQNESFESFVKHFFKSWIKTLSSMAPSAFNSLLDQEKQEEKEKIPDEKKFLKFNSEDRFKVLKEIKKTIHYYKVYSSYHIPQNYLFSVIALADKFLENTEREVISLSEMKLIYICAMKIIAKDFHVDAFLSDDFFQSPEDEDTLIDLEIEMLCTVDALIYPLKGYDYFQRLFAFSFQSLTEGKTGPEYEFLKNILLKFYQIFYEFCFLFTIRNSFIEEQLRPSIVFSTCFKLTFEKLKEILGSENSIFFAFEQIYELTEKKINYPIEKYTKYKQEVEEVFEKISKYINHY